MSVKFSDNPVHLRDGIRLDREYAKPQPQEDQNVSQNVVVKCYKNT